MPRIAVVRGKEPDGILLLETDDGVARVVAPLPSWHGAELHAQLEVPDGDLEHPQVSAGIVWPW